MSIEIDKIGFATSQYVLNMADLALPASRAPENSAWADAWCNQYYVDYRRYCDACPDAAADI